MIDSTAEDGFNLQTIAIHMTLSVLYALMIVPLVHRLTISLSVVAGGLLGAGLYLLNYLVSTNLIGAPPSQREIAILVTHIVFGMIAVGAYRGLAKSRAELS